ncbi:hypothetical protein JOF56_006955 [Kibdelosporangium banguiense]|uniref:Peptidoglycan binding-like domain-containing protein n=1 Tax=Kibdelosporangium banguiense TaxID=1365924 RepID=A0ABS4TRJ8_9PSEU|nr:peptidoglycan-binding protein [Kibdelosporangium banguiense]MBP2326570.1 hypothetical protein [Kibdelosporangium banguiense]
MPKSRRRATVVVTAALIAVVIASAVALIVHNRPPEPTPAGAPQVKVATVRKADLANTKSMQAMIGFGTPRQIKGTGTGVVTRLPAVGDVAQAGKPLYWVNDQPVPVFFGPTPLFRKLEAPGAKGSDVAMMMDNLARLGYQVGRRPKDDTKAELTPTVIEAIKKWQRKAGLEDTGTVDVGQILVLDTQVRVASVQAQPGAAATEQLFTVTPNSRVVTMSVPMTEAGGLKAGTSVSLVRPDSRQVPAKIQSATPAVPNPEAQGGAGAEQKLDVVMVADDPADVADLAPAPIQLNITTESRSGVLTVPVEALVALREGGYAVQLRGGELRAVKTGLYSQDKVEVSGSGITEGLEVVTAS